MSREAIFTPYVHVDEDGTITTDWFDVFSHVHNSETIKDEFEEPEGNPFSTALDKRLDEIRQVIAEYNAGSGCDGFDGESIAHQLVDLIRPFFVAAES